MGAEQSQLRQAKESPDFHQDFISFFVNGQEHNVKTSGCDPEIGPQYLLVDYLRDKLGLTGTKYMCREGGCGSCIVAIRSIHPTTREWVQRSANSCLLPLFACDGLDITTVERLGNRKIGYNAIQDRLVKFGGTQCGFCTPGFVMNMYSVAQNKPDFTAGDVEYSFDGNICRCTGYRPIIEGFKSLIKKPPEELLKQKCPSQDIEECHKCPFKSETEEEIFEGPNLEIIQLPRKLYFKSTTGEEWFKVTSLATLFKIVQKLAYSRMKYRLIAGNTGTGVFKNDGPYQAFIEINDISDLQLSRLDATGLVLGGCVTLTAAIDTFFTARSMEGFIYAGEFYKHFRRIACLSVRNQGTLAGNLMLKHQHHEFPSDIFTLFESVGATLKIGSSPTMIEEYTLVQFLELDMNGKVILSIHFPTYKENYFYRSFKISKRYQNSEAYVNAAFLFNIDSHNNFTVIKKPSMCFGGIDPEFIHASSTEDYLTGKSFDTKTLQNALSVLRKEAIPNIAPERGSEEYRLNLAQAYLYKFMLGVRGGTVNPNLQSGGDDVERALNTASQTYDTDRSKWPLYQPVPKIESFPQTSGEAEYINDIRAESGELFGVFVTTTVANGTIKHVDASKALAIPDVVAFVTARDIPGQNNYTPFFNYPEEIFISQRVQYYGQPVGLLVARNKYTAFQARSEIRVSYQDSRKPVVSLRDAVKNSSLCKDLLSSDDINLAMPCRGFDSKTTKKLLMNVKKSLPARATVADKKVQDGMIQVKGEFYSDRQYHFHMENQICICVPRENGMDVFSSTQHMDSTQAAIATALNVPCNSINVNVRRLGGGFGAKVSKASLIAAACAVAAHVTNKPVRIALDLETNMHMIGKRLPYLTKYEVEVDQTGKIHKLNADIYCDAGVVPNEPTSLFAMISVQSCYRAEGWSINPGSAVTETAPNTYCRAPGSSQGIAAIENIMEHIAFAVNRDPLKVRQVNFIHKGDPLIGVPGAKFMSENFIPKMLQEILQSSDYLNRKKSIEVFNQGNRWKKRGISIVPQRYPNSYAEFRFPTFISVYHFDGSVNVSHAGIEMGQGINTKVAQVVAHTLQIPLDKVTVQPSNTVISPNTAITAASVTSELVCSSARLACEQLLEKLAPVRKELGNPTWEQLISGANAREILLTSQAQEMQGDVISYDVWGLTAIEVEVDVLTGDYKINRVDILEDAGQSLSPLVDIGQVEGAFIMGLGWWLTEELVYDTSNGALLTDNTWLYKPMLPADIPEDFRVTLLRNAPNPHGVLSSKATGEPPLNMSCSVIFALRNAINSARRDAGDHSWYQLDGPVTREVIRRAALTSAEQFSF